jgi:chaperonin cofactor prefoldin
MKKKTAIITVIATVAAIGAAIFVAKKGPELKKELLEKVDTLKGKVKDLEVSEVKDAIQEKLVEIKNDIKDFDWEKPKEEVGKKF